MGSHAFDSISDLKKSNGIFRKKCSFWLFVLTAATNAVDVDRNEANAANMQKACSMESNNTYFSLVQIVVAAPVLVRTHPMTHISTLNNLTVRCMAFIRPSTVIDIIYENKFDSYSMDDLNRCQWLQSILNDLCLALSEWTSHPRAFNNNGTFDTGSMHKNNSFQNCKPTCFSHWECILDKRAHDSIHHPSMFVSAHWHLQFYFLLFRRTQHTHVLTEHVSSYAFDKETLKICHCFG